MRLPRVFNTLKTVLILQVALPVLLLLGLVLSISLSVVGEFVEQRMQQDLQLVARTIHLPVSRALHRQDLPQLQNSMASVFAQANVYGAYLFDANGDRLSSFGVVNPTRRQATEALKKAGEGEFAQYERISGRRVYSFFMPIFDQAGRPNGLLQVTRRRSDIDNELSTLHRATWGGFVLVSLLVLGTLVMTHQRAVGTPLSRLLESMKRVSDGDKTHRARAQGPRELKQLAIGLNGMLDAIDAAEDSEKVQRRAREKMAKRLRHSETMAALGQLSAGVAHELGAPLTVVDGRANRLLRRTDDAEQSRELNTIRQQVRRMTAIVEQLLSFGRSARHNRQRIDVSTLVQRARKQLDDEGCRITLVPGPAVSLHGDPLSLEQALVNLMRNACQARADGDVQVSWQRTGDDLFIQVDDDGPGIPGQLRQSVFDPFVTTKQPGEGSGLGLAIVRRIVRDHDGDIMLDDSPLGGARFQLRIPMKQDTYPA